MNSQITPVQEEFNGFDNWNDFKIGQFGQKFNNELFGHFEDSSEIDNHHAKNKTMTNFELRLKDFQSSTSTKDKKVQKSKKKRRKKKTKVKPKLHKTNSLRRENKVTMSPMGRVLEFMSRPARNIQRMFKSFMKNMER